jgi:insertion element IS1 protein InsB
MWSFVLWKQDQAWLWLVLCRRTRQIVAYFLGDRSADSCRKLWERIPLSYRGVHLYSDFWEAYRAVLPEETHQAVGKESGQTNHIERFNNTLRQRLGCLVRKALSFSKCWFWHEVRIVLFLLRYNQEKRDEYLALNPQPKTT